MTKMSGRCMPPSNGIVHDEDVARRHVVAEVAHDRFHGGRHRAEMPRQRQALRRQLAVGVGEAGRVVHVVLEHARVGGAEDGERHLVMAIEKRDQFLNSSKAIGS